MSSGGLAAACGLAALPLAAWIYLAGRRLRTLALLTAPESTRHG